MSDRTNRDKGRRVSYNKHKHLCDCWHCTDGKTKFRLLSERSAGKHRKKVLAEELS